MKCYRTPNTLVQPGIKRQALCHNVKRLVTMLVLTVSLLDSIQIITNVGFMHRYNFDYCKILILIYC